MLPLQRGMAWSKKHLFTSLKEGLTPFPLQKGKDDLSYGCFHVQTVSIRSKKHERDVTEVEGVERKSRDTPWV